jgi:branched-chain amino acid transport system substrate-binding protein
VSPSARRLTVLLLPLLLACCRQPAGSLRIGLVVPLSGGLRDTGLSFLEGAELAVAEVNGTGGLSVRGRSRLLGARSRPSGARSARSYRVELVVRDAQDSPEGALGAAQELINGQEVAALIAPPFSSQAIPVARLAERSGMPLLVPMATHPQVTSGTSCVFRVCFTDGFQGRAMARFARERLGARRAAVLYDLANPFSRDIAEIFAATFRQAGGRLVAREGYLTGQADFRPELARIARRGPEVLFLPGLPPELRTQLRQLRSLGLPAQLLGVDTMYFRDAGDLPLVEGAIFSTHFSAEMPGAEVQAFNRLYHGAYQRLPPPPGSALTYDALQLLFSVIRSQGDTQPQGICAGLRRLERFEGVTGTMVFAGRPDPDKSVVILHVRERQYRYLTRIDP